MSQSVEAVPLTSALLTMLTKQRWRALASPCPWGLLVRPPAAAQRPKSQLPSWTPFRTVGRSCMISPQVLVMEWGVQSARFRHLWQWAGLETPGHHDDGFRFRLAALEGAI